MHVRPLEAPAPHIAHARVSAQEQTTFLLESREGPERIARYSILGFDPVGTVTCDANGIRVTGSLPEPSTDQDPITYLRRIHAFYATDEHPTPFVGGLVGSLGYDFVRVLEPTLEMPGPESWPRCQFGVYLDGIVWDHHEGTCVYVSRGEDRSARAQGLLASPDPGSTLQVGPLSDTVGDAPFKARVLDAQQQIRQGEAFQIVLSRAFQAHFEGDLAPLYAKLRDAAPVPYLYHLRFPGNELLGASPEMLVRVREGRAETFPIAGTRPLTGDEAIDRAAGEDLQSDRKETAEHAMLVDLARNDLSRVCEKGSVVVEDFQSLHRFRSVQHLVSHVAGALTGDAWDALAAVFPAGTVSGAPKIRAMEHIDRIEGAGKAPRGPYAGAVAYHAFHGDFDSAITIRSLSAQDSVLTVQAGAGITIQSDPDAEEAETRHKAGTMLDVLRLFQEAP